MNFRKNSVLIIGSSIALVLLIIALVFLIHNQGQYRDHLAALNASKNRLNSLNTRNPYPSAENVTIAQSNLDVLKQQFDSIWSTLVNRQLEVQMVEPARFADLLEKSVTRVYDHASDQGVGVASDLTLGFKDYAAGTLPPDNASVMKRLVLQLDALENLCMLLIDAKVQSIDRLGRDIFETKKGADSEEDNSVRGRRSSSRRSTGTEKQEMVLGLPVTGTNALYDTERFLLEFTGWESSVWNVLNGLASSDIAYEVIDVSFENTIKNPGAAVDMTAKLNEILASKRQAQSNRGGGTQVAIKEITMEEIAHEDRIVGGREPIKTKIILTMYQFSETADGEAQP